MTQSDEPPSEFARVASAAEIAPGTARACAIGEREVALFNVGGQFFALENTCPHQGGPIAGGTLEGALVTCPWHGWCFDVRTGKMTLGEFASIDRYAVRQAGRDIYVSREPVV